MRLFRSKLLYRNKIAIFLLSTLITNVSLSDIHKDAPSIIQRREEPRNFVSFDLGPWMNNKAFGDEADFDGVGTFFSEHSLQSSGMLINYPVNNSTAKGFDHIKINEEITIPLRTTDDYAPIPLGTLYLLVSSTRGPLTAKITVSYTDQTQDSTTLSLPDWQDNLIDQIERYQPVQLPLSNGKKGAMFSTPIYVNPEKTPTQLHLLQGQKTPSEAALHVFSVVGHRATQNKLIITSVQATQEWINAREQVIVVRVHNVGTDYIKNVSLHVSHRQEGGQVKTTKESVIKSIAPGHTYMAHVTIEYSSRLETNQATPVKITAKYIGEKDKITSTVISTNVMIPVFPDSYKATAASVQKHRSPTWLKQAKFGIFIHWGLYSVPAWAPVGKAYAEWYWWRLNQPGDPAFAYHRDMYGEKFEYDQFLEQWKPTQFDARVWLDLIDRSRAKYYVFTTKHHDGIALFDTNVTDRSTTKLLQHNRDFVKELMHTSEQTYPHLKRGLYFSLPEWYHPKYHDQSLGWHGPPINPYTGKNITYTGSKSIDDFVNELQVPQLRELVNYNPDILWCDIGGIHNSSVWQADYFNRALQQGRSVAVNDRCGDGSASDFTTIEYQAVSNTPTRFWEATRGMDPYSFGFNRETKPEDYANTNDLIENLVDAVSRGGNFLLNIGPEASGEVPEPMVKRLLEIGQWLDLVGAGIFDSTPYWITSNERNLRFTASQNGDSVYVFSFPLNSTDKHSTHHQIVIQTPLPVKKGARISLMNRSEIKVSWRYDTKGHLLLEFDLLESNQVLVFEIST